MYVSCNGSPANFEISNIKVCTYWNGARNIKVLEQDSAWSLAAFVFSLNQADWLQGGISRVTLEIFCWLIY